MFFSNSRSKHILSALLLMKYMAYPDFQSRIELSIWNWSRRQSFNINLYVDMYWKGLVIKPSKLFRILASESPGHLIRHINKPSHPKNKDIDSKCLLSVQNWLGKNILPPIAVYLRPICTSTHPSSFIIMNQYSFRPKGYWHILK